jgi:hypothetical protein
MHLVRAFSSRLGLGYQFHIQEKIADIISKYICDAENFRKQNYFGVMAVDIMKALKGPAGRDLIFHSITMTWKSTPQPDVGNPINEQHFVCQFVYFCQFETFFHLSIHAKAKNY